MPEVFAQATAPDGVWHYKIICDDDDRRGAGSFKVKAAKGWDHLKKTGEADAFKEQGLGKSDWFLYVHRQRLMKRGYLALVGVNTQMSRMNGVAFVHGSEMMLRTLGHWVS